MDEVSEKKYFDVDAAYDSKTLTDWYISSVDDNPPVWTDEHIYELLNDFYVIPKDTKPANVAPVVNGTWCGSVCSSCGESTSYWYNCNYCPNCGAKMDEREDKANE